MRIFRLLFGRTYDGEREMQGASQHWKRSVNKAVKDAGADPKTSRGKIIVEENTMRFEKDAGYNESR